MKQMIALTILLAIAAQPSLAQIAGTSATVADRATHSSQPHSAGESKSSIKESNGDAAAPDQTPFNDGGGNVTGVSAKLDKLLEQRRQAEETQWGSSLGLVVSTD